MGLDSLRLCHSHLSTFEPCNLKMMTAPHQSQFSNWNFPANIRSTTKSHLKHSVRMGRFDKVKVYVIYYQSIFNNAICIDCCPRSFNQPSHNPNKILMIGTRQLPKCIGSLHYNMYICFLDNL